MLKMLDLFSAIGGFSLAASWTGQIETVAFCEIEPYCQKVLKKHWPDVPIFSDIKELRGEDVGAVDIVCGGFPCQPFSCAGKRRGKEDDRYLWPEMFRIIQETKPAWIVGENVAGFVNMGLDDCISDLESEGYEVQPLIIPACSVNAPHRRDRVWIISYASGKQANQQLLRSSKLSRQSWQPLGTRQKTARQEDWAPSNHDTTRFCEILADPDIMRMERERPQQQATRINGESEMVAYPKSQESPVKHISELIKSFRLRTGSGEGTSGSNWWAIEPDVGRVAYGIPYRVDRLRGLGNAIVPQVAYQIFKAIVEIESAHASSATPLSPHP